MQTLPALAAAARQAATPYGRERLLTLPGTIGGEALRAWEPQVRARYGAAIVAALRAIPAFATLPADPDPATRLPIGLPTALTTVLVETALDGDWLALERPLREDATAPLGKARRVLLRALGPQKVLAGAGAAHRSLYDRGTVEVRTEAGEADLRIRGSALFVEPAWLLLQAFALRATVGLAAPGAEVEVTARTVAEDACHLSVHWTR
ncbi:MAG: hypothetical protein H6747_12920 [Deltaproteobacteria bacterium]|nr:hypothetical protein [Deltaproteobacteria bacterium]